MTTATTTTSDEQVYGEYRRVLAQYSTVYASFPARAKQEARKAVVTKYGMPFSSLKTLIKQQDEINGVVEEKPKVYSYRYI